MKKEYSSKKHATYMRKYRKRQAEKDPLALRKMVWVIQTADGKQIVFRDKKDININRIPKEKLKHDFIKAY